MSPDFVRRDALGCSKSEFTGGIRFKPANALASVTTVIRDSRQRSYVGAAQRPSLELEMSDTINAFTSAVRQSNGHFAKGTPGGPGRPRGSVSRRTVAPKTIVLVVAPERGDDDNASRALKHRIAALEARLRAPASADAPKTQAKSFSDRFRRFCARLTGTISSALKHIANRLVSRPS